MFAGGVIGMTFKTKFVLFCHFGFCQNALNELRQMFDRKESWCATAQVNFFNDGSAFEQLAI